MNLVQLISALGVWGQHHATAMLVGVVGLPVALGLVSLALRVRRGDPGLSGEADSMEGYAGDRSNLCFFSIYSLPFFTREDRPR